MRVGINLISTPHYEPDELVTRFFQKFLQYSVEAKDTNDFFIFITEGSCETNFPNAEVIQIPPIENRLLSKLYIRSTPLDSIIRKFSLDTIISPLENAMSISSIPCIPIVLHTESWYREQDLSFFTNRDLRKNLVNCPLWITTSEYGRKLCLEEWKVPLNKVVSVPVGVEKSLSKAPPPIIQQKYLVSVVDDSTIRHLPDIVEVLKNLQTDSPYSILLIGKTHKREPKDWGENVLRIEKCPDNTLGGILHHATAFIYPSLHDISAMRVIEALQAGTCVIAPFNPAFEEKCSELPFYYQGGSISSFNSTLNRVLSLSEEERLERIRLGRVRVGEYSWQDTAWKIITTIKKFVL